MKYYGSLVIIIKYKSKKRDSPVDPSHRDNLVVETVSYLTGNHAL